MPTVKALRRKRPDWRDETWKLYRLLYEGGEALAREKQRLIKRHPAESSTWYEQRLERFSYKNTAGMLVTEYTAAVFQSGLEVLHAKDSGEEKRKSLPDYYAQLIENPTGAGQGTLDDFVEGILEDAMQVSEGWVLATVPSTDAARNRREQEQAGGLDVTLHRVPAEQVINAGWDEQGLKFVIREERIRPDEPLDENGDERKDTLRWTYMTRPTTFVYELEVEPNAEPSEKAEVAEKEQIANRWDVVPMVRLKLKKSLWMIDRLALLVAEETRKRSGLAWYEDLACIPQLVHAGDEPLLKPEDPNRRGAGTNSKRGSQFVFEIDQDDKLDWLELDGSSLSHIRERLAEIASDCQQVVHHMAAASASGGQASVLARSGLSKMRDAVSKVILCQVYARLSRDFVKQVMELVAAGRKDTVDFDVSGLDAFDMQDPDTLVDASAVALTLGLHSDTAKREIERRLIRTLLPDADAAVKDEIEKELKAADFSDHDPFEPSGDDE